MHWQNRLQRTDLLELLECKGSSEMLWMICVRELEAWGAKENFDEVSPRLRSGTFSTAGAILPTNAS